MKTDFVALCASQKAEKRALVRIGGPQKVGDRTIVSCEGAIDDCLIKILAFSTDASVFRQRRITSDELYNNSRFKQDASKTSKYQI